MEDIDKKQIIGMLKIMNIEPITKRGDTSVIIANKEYWGQGFGYAFALARTYYAAKLLDLNMLFASAYTTNVASWKNLEKLGYFRYGEVPVSEKIEGNYVGTYKYVWYNPYKVKELFAKGVPAELESSLSVAKKALEQAEKIVEFL